MPAHLAQRIAVYSDNVIRQLQLDRHCERLESQRRLKARQAGTHNQDTDFVWLNKTAAVLPAATLPGENTYTGKALSIQKTRAVLVHRIHNPFTYVLLLCFA